MDAWHEIEAHDFVWPENYHLILNPSEERIFLRSSFNPNEWEPTETYHDLPESFD
jgi:hypothetical protein